MLREDVLLSGSACNTANPQAAAEKAAEEEKRDLSGALEGFKPLQARHASASGVVPGSLLVQPPARLPH